MKKLTTRDQTTEFLLYTAPNGGIKVEVLLSHETIWLTQKRMAELFGVGVAAISKHLDNIYATGELQREATISILETVQQKGARQVARKLECFNLDAVISVGYRVNSAQATQFRIWAAQLIKEYIKKLERAVAAFFDYIERIIEQRTSFTMAGFAESVDKFLAFNEYRVLEGYGKVSREQAEQIALAEYEKFNKQQRIESDFDRQVKKLLHKGSAGE